MNSTSQTYLKDIYRLLFNRFGPQSWWPGESPFEVIVGAILTQNTNWKNVEKALLNLKQARILTPTAMRTVTVLRLARLIRPVGFFNIKARRLKNFIEYFFLGYNGKIENMKKEPWPKLRRELLSVHGIGPETADSILLYALEKPVFVVDAYTKRMLSRHDLISREAGYSDIQQKFLKAFKPDIQIFNEYHALIVRVAKDYCRSTALCEACPLNGVNSFPVTLELKSRRIK